MKHKLSTLTLCAIFISLIAGFHVVMGWFTNNDFIIPISSNLARNNICNHISKLKILTRDNPSQPVILNSLVILTDKHSYFLLLNTPLSNERGFEAANYLLATKQGKYFTYAIRKMMAEVTDKENNLPELKQAENNKSVASFYHAFVIFLICVFILLVIIFFAIYNNINIRKKTEARIWDSEQMFSTLFHKSPIMKTIAEAPSGKYLDVNDAFSDFLERSKEEIHGKTPDELDMRMDHAKRAEIINNLMKNGFVREIETQLTSSTGKVKWISVSMDLIELNGKNRFVMVAVDVTKRKEAEDVLARFNNELELKVKERTEELTASEMRFRSIIEQYPSPVIRYSPEGTLISVNPAWEVMWGDKKENVTGYNILMDPEMKASGLSKVVEKAFAGEVSRSDIYPYDPVLIGKTGKKRWTQMIIYPLKGANGEILEVILMLLDMTDNKEAEEKINQLNASLENKVIERTAQLEAVNKELEAFTYSVSHDLRAPLRAVNGFAKILESQYDEQLDSEGKRLLGVVQQNARQMGVLIDDLLEFSRLGRKDIKKGMIDMNNLVNSALFELNKAGGNNCEVKTSTLHTALGDYALMNHVVINLISNAIKYSSKVKKPLIEISSKKEDTELIYAIKDNGAGFDMRYAGKLFGVFQRLHSTSEFEGTGVGLAIVQRIVSRHGGRVWAEGEVGKGATFYFSLPEKNN